MEKLNGLLQALKKSTGFNKEKLLQLRKGRIKKTWSLSPPLAMHLNDQVNRGKSASLSGFGKTKVTGKGNVWTRKQLKKSHPSKKLSKRASGKWQIQLPDFSNVQFKMPEPPTVARGEAGALDFDVVQESSNNAKAMEIDGGARDKIVCDDTKKVDSSVLGKGEKEEMRSILDGPLDSTRVDEYIKQPMECNKSKAELEKDLELARSRFRHLIA